MPLGIYTSNAFRNAAGVQVVANANVEVRRESDGNLAVIYSTRDADSNTEIDQVGYPGTTGFKADADGYFEFFADGIADGYRVRVYSDDLSLDKTLRYQPTGTARELDADPFWAVVLAAPNAAAARAPLQAGLVIPVNAISSINPDDATTYYIGQGFIPTTSEGVQRLRIPRAGTIKRVDMKVLVVGTLGSAETSTMSLRLNGTTDTEISAAVVANALFQEFANSALAIEVVAGNYFEIKWVTPTWVTNPTTVYVNGTVYIE